MTKITITTNDREVQDAIRRAANRITDLTPVMESIGEYFLLRTRERFDMEMAPGGAKWAPLAQATVKRKAKRGARGGKSIAGTNAPGNAILKDTYLLRDTITYQASAVSVAIGTPQRYGLHHQYGTQRMPARPFLGIDRQDREEIVSIVEEGLAISGQ